MPVMPALPNAARKSSVVVSACAGAASATATAINPATAPPALAIRRNVML